MHQYKHTYTHTRTYTHIHIHTHAHAQAHKDALEKASDNEITSILDASVDNANRLIEKVATIFTK